MQAQNISFLTLLANDKAENARVILSSVFLVTELYVGAG